MPKDYVTKKYLKDTLQESFIENNKNLVTKKEFKENIDSIYARFDYLESHLVNVIEQKIDEKLEEKLEKKLDQKLEEKLDEKFQHYFGIMQVYFADWFKLWQEGMEIKYDVKFDNHEQRILALENRRY